MERMKINAATASLKNGSCKQMIEIYQHSEQKNQISTLPFIPITSIRKNSGKNKMQKIMNDRLNQIGVF
jgi:hypothetical protein